MTYWCSGVSETIKLIKKHFPSVPIALSGIYATLCHDHAKNNFEGASKRVQKSSKGKVYKQELEKVLNHFRDLIAGNKNNEKPNNLKLDIGVYVLLGLPGQTIEEIVETMEFVNSIGRKIEMAEYSPVPKTVEFNQAKELYQDVIDEPLLHNKSISPPISMNISYKAFNGLKAIGKQLNMKL